MKTRYVLTADGPMRKDATPDLMAATLEKNRRRWRTHAHLEECEYVIRFVKNGPLRQSALALKAQLRNPTTGEPA